MGIKSDIRLIDDNGLRIDGRLPNQLRPIKMEVGVLERADGCLLYTSPSPRDS